MNRRQFLKSIGLMALASPFLGMLTGKKDDQAQHIVITETESYDGEYVIRPDPFPCSGKWVSYDGIIQIDLETGEAWEK